MAWGYRWYEHFTIGSIYPMLLGRMAQIPIGDRKDVRILDLAAGGGALSIPAAGAGFNITPCDLLPEYLAKWMETYAGLPFDEAWEKLDRGSMSPELRRNLVPEGARIPEELEAVPGDLEARLPFDDASFDWVMALEVIEHLENRHNALHEMRRIIKPGGTLILSTPNMLSCRARMAMAFAGQRTFQTWLDEHSGVHSKIDDRIYQGHAFLVDYFELRYSLHQCGFKIRELLSSSQSASNAVLLPFVWPLMAFATWRASKLGEKRFKRRQKSGRIDPAATPPHAEMRRHALSLTLALNKSIVIEAEAI